MLGGADNLGVYEGARGCRDARLFSAEASRSRQKMVKDCCESYCGHDAGISVNFVSGLTIQYNLFEMVV